MDQTKTITIVDLKPVSGMKKDGSGMWNKFNIKGNDGITYTTWDQNFFLQRKIGDVIDLTFFTTTYQGQRGLVTNYNIVVEKSGPQGVVLPPNQYKQHAANMPSRDNPGVNQNVAAMIAEIKRAEINIIAAIRAHCGTDIKPIQQLQTQTIPVINETDTGNYEVGTEEVEEESDGNPF
jgi:hypothetical protein